MKRRMPLGPVMLDLPGQALETSDRSRLLHPQCGGVIMFSRNFQDPRQLSELCRQIRQLREPELLIAVDHEGGRVQRFREGFTAVPPMRALGRLWDRDRQGGARAAREVGYLMGRELAVHGVDFSFTPVLDLDYGSSTVIGDRALHSNADAVSELGAGLIAGLRAAGVASVGKHFPGHGHVEADSHIDVPVDRRTFAEIERADLIPFARLAKDGLAAVMPAHVIYPAVDDQPAGFSRVWLQDVLRGKLEFRGVIFSDDLTMEGARVAGGIEARAQAALSAGCNMVLVCNRPDAADCVLATLDRRMQFTATASLEVLHSAPGTNSQAPLAGDSRYAAAVRTVSALASGEGTAVA